MATILFMTFLAIVYFGFGLMKTAFEKDDPSWIEKHGVTEAKSRVGVFALGIGVLFVAWLFYMIATGQI